MTEKELDQKYPRIEIEEDKLFIGVFRKDMLTFDGFGKSKATFILSSSGYMNFHNFTKAQLQVLSKVALILADRME